MAEMQESSVLFSLKQLMNIEDDRLREEQEAAKRKADAELAARQEAERIQRQQEEARLKAEEERRRLEEARRREEEARLEAIRLAEVTKAKVEAEQKARLAAMQQEQEHERKLAALQQDGQKKRLKRTLVIGGALAVAVIGGSLGVYFGQIKPESDRLHQEQIAALAAQADELKRLQAEADKAAEREKKALEDLAKAKDERERIRAAQAVADSKKAKEAAQRTLASAKKPSDKPGGACACLEGDPMCSCLK